MKYLVYGLVYLGLLSVSYHLRILWSLIILVAVCIIIISTGLKSSIYESIAVMIILFCVPFITYRFKRKFQEYKLLMKNNLEKSKASYNDILSKDKEQAEDNLEREKRLEQILSLYDISREMGGYITVEDILNIYASELKKIFRFRFATVILFKMAEEIESIYRIGIGKAITRVAPDLFDNELISIIKEVHHDIIIAQENICAFRRRLETQRHFDTFVAVPIFEKGKLVVIFCIENLPRIYNNYFMILANQCAIHLKKALLYREVQEMSIIDYLTGINNRRYFLERFCEELRRSMHRKMPFSFLMLDLDYFKNINDIHGHLVGDVVLKEVASILKSQIREIDIIGRIGGEEFGVVLSGTGRNEAIQIAERLRSRIEMSVIRAYDVTITLTISIGVAVFPDDGFDRDTIIESADKALYKAKQLGRNRVF